MFATIDLSESILLILVIALLVFWVAMFADIFRNRKLTAVGKTLWAIGLLLMPALVWVYFFVARSKKH